MSNFIIYGLVDPRNNQLRYIGKSVSGLKRPRSHSQSYYLKQEAHLYKTKWINDLIKEGMLYSIIVIQDVGSVKDLYYLEHKWILYFKKMGCPLTNLTDGGKGHYGYKISEESRIKMSLAKKGKPLTEEHKRKLSNSHKGKVFSDEHLKNLKIANKRPSKIPWPLIGGLIELISLYNQGIVAQMFSIDRKTLYRKLNDATSIIEDSSHTSNLVAVNQFKKNISSNTTV